MMKRSDHDVCDFFDGVARNGLWHSFDEHEMPLLHAMLNMWNIRPGDRILEPGCGRGRLTAILADAVGHQGGVVAIDIAEEMARACRERGLPRQVEVLNCALINLPNTLPPFDKAICCNVWPHLLNPRQVLAKLHAALRADGDLWIAHLTGREVINEIHRNAGEDVCDHLLPPADELSELIADCGFVVNGFEDSADRYWIHATNLNYSG